MSIATGFVTFIKTYSAGVIAATISTGFVIYISLNGQVVDDLPNIKVRHNPVVSPLNGKIAGRTVPKQWTPDGVLPIVSDQLLTGSLPGATSKLSRRSAKQDRKRVFSNPLDSTQARYILRVATEKIALVEGRGKLWSVHPGRLLPGHGRVLKIVKKNKHWVVVTTQGEIRP